MDNIPLLHTSQAFPFIDFLNSNGCSTRQLLHTAKLPLALLDRTDGYIVENNLWLLLDIVAETQGLADFGSRVGHKIHIISSKNRTIFQ